MKSLGLDREPSVEKIYFADRNNVLTKEAAFRKIQKRTKLKPAEILIVGDRPAREIRAGKELGMHTVRLHHGEFKSQEPVGPEEEPDYVSEISLRLKSCRLSGVTGPSRKKSEPQDAAPMILPTTTGFSAPRKSPCRAYWSADTTCSFFMAPLAGSKVKTVSWFAVLGKFVLVEDCVTMTKRPVGSMAIPVAPLPAASDVPIWLMLPSAGEMANMCTTPALSTTSRNLFVLSTTMSCPEPVNS